MIRIEHISKNYGRTKALDDVSAEFIAGQSIALIGPNGSGKSTLMKCLLGLVYPQNGSISIFGGNIASSIDYKSRIGYMPQIVHFPPNMKVRQLFSMVKDIRKHRSAFDMHLFEQFGIGGFSDKPLGALSGGMKQKVNAAIAFLCNPDILILDEPTAGLDPHSAEILKEKIRIEKAAGKLVILSSHIMADLEEITSHVVYLMEGKIEFFKGLDELMAELQTSNLSKAIAKLTTIKSAQ